MCSQSKAFIKPLSGKSWYIVSKLLHSRSGISEKLWSKFFFKMHQCSEIQKKFYVYVQVHILFRKVAALFATSKDIFSNLCNILLIHALFFAQFSHQSTVKYIYTQKLLDFAYLCGSFLMRIARIYLNIYHNRQFDYNLYL